MKIEQARWSQEEGWVPAPPSWSLGESVQVVLLFGGAHWVQKSESFGYVKQLYPKAHILGCSTSGEIHDTRVADDTVSITAIAFEHTRVAVARAKIETSDHGFEAGQRLARELDPQGLRHVFVMSEGLKVNASDLVRGLDAVLPAGVTCSGGCAGDGNRLETTHVWCDGEPEQAAVVALGLYGERLKVGVAAIGGWRCFGPDRVITKSNRNVLYEFDGRPALALYKEYLGEYAEDLPASGLKFPLELRGPDGEPILRALLAVNEEEQSITYAGNVPEGAKARFMIGRIDDLIAATQVAARDSVKRLGAFESELSLLVSCNGRRYILKQRVEEEIEAVREALGTGPVLAGFYSYGEIARPEGGTSTALHNETMTITSLSEA